MVDPFRQATDEHGPLTRRALQTPRAAAVAGILFAVTDLLVLVLLLAINLSLWTIMVFPLWVLAVSIYVLIVSLRGRQAEADGAVGARQ